jgi:(S)-2-hydroxyglutarate dehydrogenase
LRIHFDITIIGGGILGTSIAYFLSSVCSSSNILLVEQESKVAFHTSSRNTGKVHAPFLYDPVNKKLFAKAASLGYDMWHKYSMLKKVQFNEDGVLEVATDESGIDRLQKYMKWGEANGLKLERNLKFLEDTEVKDIEPNVRCCAALYCLKDASTDYGSLAMSLLQDSESFGCKVLLGYRVKQIKRSGDVTTISLIKLENKEETGISTNFVINAAGGNALDIAHSMHVAKEYSDFHFRGEYWVAPPEYRDLTKLSIYSVPKYPEYPFLDPHWIVHLDRRCEVGPNAVPVFSPYAYRWTDNLRNALPKIIELSMTVGGRKIFYNRQFLTLASYELKSSLSKTAMINRVKEFLPQLKPAAFSQRGTAGIRSSLIDKEGKFVPDTLIINEYSSIHVLNFNSPGATGALPIAAMLVNKLAQDGIVSWSNCKATKSLWDIRLVADEMKG